MSSKTHAPNLFHLRLGWWSLFAFISLGLVLEALHGFKVGYYLDVDNSTRRLMWTLAHAHGTLLGLLNLAFVQLLAQRPAWRGSRRTVASRSLAAATLLLPGGFFAGGFGISGGDPGIGVLAAGLGGLALALAALLCAAAATVSPASARDSEEPAVAQAEASTRSPRRKK